MKCKKGYPVTYKLNILFRFLFLYFLSGCTFFNKESNHRSCRDSHIFPRHQFPDSRIHRSVRLSDHYLRCRIGVGLPASGRNGRCGLWRQKKRYDHRLCLKRQIGKDRKHSDGSIRPGPLGTGSRTDGTVIHRRAELVSHDAHPWIQLYQFRYIAALYP